LDKGFSRSNRKFKEMNPLNALLEVSLYFLKFIEYKKPSGFGGSEGRRHSSLL
jgi:hypothetical protein